MNANDAGVSYCRDFISNMKGLVSFVILSEENYQVKQVTIASASNTSSAPC